MTLLGHKMASTTLSILFDPIYPIKCGLCDLLGDESICSICRADFEALPLELVRRGGPLDYAASIFAYSGRAAQAVQRLKYERVTSLAEPMARAVAEGAEARGLMGADIFIPVPIHWTRRNHRGFNQSELLCEHLPSNLVDASALRRAKATRPQVGLPVAERLSNLQNAFVVRRSVSGKRVLLVDDVHTSGGTGNECACALKEAGAVEVGLLTFAGE